MVVVALAVIFPPFVPTAIPSFPTFKVPPPFKAISEVFPSAYANIELLFVSDDSNLPFAKSNVNFLSFTYKPKEFLPTVTSVLVTFPFTPRATIPIPRSAPVVFPTAILLLVVVVSIVKSLPSLKTSPLALVPKFILKSLTLTGLTLFSKYAPTNLSFVPLIFPRTKSFVVLALIAISPVASFPINLISPSFVKLVLVRAESFVVYIATPFAPIFTLAPVWLCTFAPFA